MIRALLGTAFAGLLLAGCSMPQNTTTTTTASAAKPKCDKHEAATGSHMTGNCDYRNVDVMSGEGLATSMRQHPGTGLPSQ